MRAVSNGQVYPVAGWLAVLVVPAWAAAVDPGFPILSLHWPLHCVLGWTLLRLAWIDWHTLRLPDRLTLPLIALGLAASLSSDPRPHVIGAVAGYGAFRLIGVGYRYWRGMEGLGQGDAKLLAAGGAWLGWAALPWTVLLAAGLGLGLAALAGRQPGGLGGVRVVPFGPGIALAIWIIRLHGLPGS